MTRFAPIDLSLLAKPEVIEPLDFESVFDALRDAVIAATPELADALALESEPAVKILQIWAYAKLHDRARVNDGARAVMLPYATGANLEVLSALFGVTRAEGETDTVLRDRVRLALQAYSSAGPAGAYRFHAVSADPRIRDVLVDSPTPGDVRIVVMSSDNAGVADAAMLDAVDAAVNAEDVRVLTDQITVTAASAEDFVITAELSVQGIASGIAVAMAEAALATYLERRLQLGLRVTRSGLIAALHVEGVEAVDLTAPVADVEPDVDAFARVTATAITVAVQA